MQDHTTGLAEACIQGFSYFLNSVPSQYIWHLEKSQARANNTALWRPLEFAKVCFVGCVRSYTSGVDLHCGFQKQVLRKNERTQEPGIDFKTLQRKGQTPSASFRPVAWAGLAVWDKAKGLCPWPRWSHCGRNVTSCPCHHVSPSTITHHLHIDSPGGDHQLPMQFSRYTS